MYLVQTGVHVQIWLFELRPVSGACVVHCTPLSTFSVSSLWFTCEPDVFCMYCRCCCTQDLCPVVTTLFGSCEYQAHIKFSAVCIGIKMHSAYACGDWWFCVNGGAAAATHTHRTFTIWMRTHIHILTEHSPFQCKHTDATHSALTFHHLSTHTHTVNLPSECTRTHTTECNIHTHVQNRHTWMQKQHMVWANNINIQKCMHILFSIENGELKIRAICMQVYRYKNSNQTTNKIIIMKSNILNNEAITTSFQIKFRKQNVNWDWTQKVVPGCPSPKQLHPIGMWRIVFHAKKLEELPPC